jgi:hypothetical protein
MKDITKLQIWPVLKKAGFKVQKYKIGKKIMAKGAIFTMRTAMRLNHVNVKYTLIEIEPITTNTLYKVTYDDPIGNTKQIFLNAKQLYLQLPEIISKFIKTKK